jgi:non-ribosomal peptide synthetase component F
LTLTDLFDLSFQGRRDAVGLEFGDRALTFGEIDARSNQLAQLLTRRGFKPGDRL